MRRSKSCKRFINGFLLVLVASGGMLSKPALAEEVLRIGGTGCALGSMELIAKAFEKSNPGMKIKVISPSLGSTGGISAVWKGALDIGLSARQISSEEGALGLWSMEYARTLLLFVTENKMKVSGIDTGELVKIFRGETVTWPDGQRIRPILRPSTETDTLLVKEISAEMRNAVEAALLRRGMAIALTDQECLDMIEKIPGGFGFATLTQILSERRFLRMLAFNGSEPSPATLADGSYPLSKTLHFIMKTEPSVSVRRFVDFFRSPEAREILERSGSLAVIGKPGQP